MNTLSGEFYPAITVDSSSNLYLCFRTATPAGTTLGNVANGPTLVTTANNKYIVKINIILYHLVILI